MYIRNTLLLSLVATASLTMSLPVYAERGDHGRGHRDRGHHDSHYEHRHGGGHGKHARRWQSPPRHAYQPYHRPHYRPPYVGHYAPPRYGYIAHGVYGYHEHCAHGHGYANAPVYGSGLSLWLDGIGFSYYERGW